MGFYLETPENLNKAGQLIRDAGARLHTPDLASVPEDDHLVCVVQNGFFDAAAICYDEGELAAFTEPHDMRLKDWLLVSKDKCRELCPTYDRLETRR